MKCLQEKYHTLESDCKDAVRTHTKMTMADPTLDFYMMKACEPIIQSSCAVSSMTNRNETLMRWYLMKTTDLDNENRVLQCLIKQKNNPKMDFRCRASINHHQLVRHDFICEMIDQFISCILRQVWKIKPFSVYNFKNDVPKKFNSTVWERKQSLFLVFMNISWSERLF